MMVVAPLLLDHKVSAFFSGEFTNAGAAAFLPAIAVHLSKLLVTGLIELTDSVHWPDCTVSSSTVKTDTIQL